MPKSESSVSTSTSSRSISGTVIVRRFGRPPQIDNLCHRVCSPAPTVVRKSVSSSTSRAARSSRRGSASASPDVAGGAASSHSPTAARARRATSRRVPAPRTSPWRRARHTLRSRPARQTPVAIAPVPRSASAGVIDRSNAEPSLDERPDRRRHIVRVGQRQHHRLSVRAFDRRRRRRDIRDRALACLLRLPGPRPALRPASFRRSRSTRRPAGDRFERPTRPRRRAGGRSRRTARSVSGPDGGRTEYDRTRVAGGRPGTISGPSSSTSRHATGDSSMPTRVAKSRLPVGSDRLAHQLCARQSHVTAHECTPLDLRRSGR